jgi:hypothetical protein
MGFLIIRLNSSIIETSLGLRANWNVGILEKWVLGDWIVGLMATFALTIKAKMEKILLKPNIP